MGAKITLNTIGHIVQGASKSLSEKKGETTDEVKKRAKICIDCEHAAKWIPFGMIPEKSFPLLQGKRCGICNCNLTWKIRSNDKCPLNKW